MNETRTTRLLLVRHGATPLTSENRFSGAIGVDLSDEGRAQVQCLAERLAAERIAAVYTSPLSRTIETAAILSEPHALVPIHRDGLREISHGRWEGLTRSEVESVSPVNTMRGKPTLHLRSRRRRVGRGSARAGPSRDPRDRRGPCGASVLVVSHKATLRLLISSLLGFDARGYRDRLDQSPACLNVVDCKGPVQARLMLFNDISHYQHTPRRAEAHLSKWWDAAAAPRG